MGLFVDLLHIPASVTNDALDGIYKSLSGGGHGDIWEPHDSPLIRLLIELFTKRGLDRIKSVQDQLEAWHAGENYTKPESPPQPPPVGAMGRWNPAEMALVRIYLNSLPPAAWTLDDHMLAVEWVVQTYLPYDALVQEADWLATKAAMMGKVQANIKAAPTAKQAEMILAAIPSFAAEAAKVMTPAQQTALTFAKARAVENVRALSDGVRNKMRSIIVADLEQKATGGVPTGSSSLQTKLLDAFGEFNRDWRRIAVTEAGEAQTQGFIASMPHGSKVKRVEKYAGACKFCREIDGKVATVVPADAPEKDPDTMVWAGKNNIGRSASPMKRVGDVLVPRDAAEKWWLPAGLAHPHCRGRWVQVGAPLEKGDDAEFAAMLDSILGP